MKTLALVRANWLIISALIFLNLADWVLTILCLKSGVMMEGNPLADLSVTRKLFLPIAIGTVLITTGNQKILRIVIYGMAAVVAWNTLMWILA